MKNLLVAVTVAGLLGGAALAPAFADGPRPSSGNNWPGMGEPVMGSYAPVAGPGAHWQWQITYVGSGKARGHWVLVP